MRQPLFRRIPWLKLEHILLIKLGLAVTFVALTVMPPGLGRELVAVSANLVWLFKT